MSDTIRFDERGLAALRGKLPASRNSARDLATTAQTRCVRRRALAIVGGNVDAAAKLLGAPPAHFGQSPFALNVGNRFEASLRSMHYAPLIQACREQLHFPPAAVEIEDLDRDLPWPPPRSADFQERQAEVARLRRKRTEELLAEALSGEGRGPVVLLHPRLRLEVNDTARDVEPDALFIHPATRQPRVGEVKCYVDHRHRTDAGDLASTRQQAAVYFLALEQTAERLHQAGRLSDLAAACQRLRGAWPEQGAPGAGANAIFAVTILRQPQSMRPAIGMEEIRRDVDTVARGLRRTPATLEAILTELGDAEPQFDDPAVLAKLPCAYEPAWCLGNCPLALACRREALEEGDPSYFGAVCRGTLAPAGDLYHAHALARGTRAAQGPEQEAFARRAQQLRALIDRAREAAC